MRSEQPIFIPSSMWNPHAVWNIGYRRQRIVRTSYGLSRKNARPSLNRIAPRYDRSRKSTLCAEDTPPLTVNDPFAGRPPDSKNRSR